jgi:tRNA (cytidine/uridine-2'-O-)-methyltransferase
MEIILFQPEIPQNTGNIARTCAVTHSKLSLVRPLGFSLVARRLKRSGLDYWSEVEFNVADSLEELLKESFFFLSSRAKRSYTEISFTEKTQLIFGSETKGLPQEVWEKYSDRFYTIPMIPHSRCLNLSNAVAVVLYEGLRQVGFGRKLLQIHEGDPQEKFLN